MMTERRKELPISERQDITIDAAEIKNQQIQVRKSCVNRTQEPT
jgi:hypothetical protein